MCANCVSNLEMIVGTAGVAAATLAAPARSFATKLGFDLGDHEGARDAHTAAFLHSLDLDAEEILGASAMRRAARWQRAQGVAGASLRSGRGSMRSQRRLAIP